MRNPNTIFFPISAAVTINNPNIPLLLVGGGIVLVVSGAYIFFIGRREGTDSNQNKPVRKSK